MINEPTPPSLPARIGWTAHLVLRIGLAGYLFVYGWSKVFLAQMGRADYGDALVGYGEMSPMGLLWRMVGYSVPFQFLSGVAEVLAAGLLLWRRTAGVGALVAAFDMYFVFLLNLSYDVPVKQLSLALAIGATIAAIPWVTRFLRALFGSGPIPRGPLPTIVTGRAGKIVNVAGAVLAVLAVIGSGCCSGSPSRHRPRGTGWPGSTGSSTTPRNRPPDWPMINAGNRSRSASGCSVASPGSRSARPTAIFGPARSPMPGRTRSRSNCVRPNVARSAPPSPPRRNSTCAGNNGRTAGFGSPAAGRT